MKKLLNAFVSVVALHACITWAQPAPATSPPTNTPVMEQPATNAPAASVAAIPPPPRANTAIIPQRIPPFLRAHTNFVEIAKKGDIDVLFMGDSITDWWRSAGRGRGTNDVIPMAGKAVFEKHFDSIPKDIMSDGLHPTSKGYEIWAEAVHDTLVSFLQ